jgi:hypothetical protein
MPFAVTVVTLATAVDFPPLMGGAAHAEGAVKIAQTSNRLAKQASNTRCITRTLSANMACWSYEKVYLI